MLKEILEDVVPYYDPFNGSTRKVKEYRMSVEMYKKIKEAVDNEKHIIYRCGWCGRPTDKNGFVLWCDFDEYLFRHKDSETIKVNGKCCPHGNPSCWM